MTDTLQEIQSKVVFDNHFTHHLPGDEETENFRRQVTGACYSKVHSTPVKKPRLVAHSPKVAALLGLSEEFCESDEFLQSFSGNALMPGMDPYAMCYGGHQFGTWAGQLGDGRAINLGEIVSPDAGRWTLQLKGAGPTPYSRNADGLAVLRSSIREFLCSEAMYHLGVPTTRALSLVTTGEQVERDMFYDGHLKMEPGAIVCRVAPSFVRFGSFEIFMARKEHAVLKQLADYTIETDFHDLGPPSTRVYEKWFRIICEKTADMIVDWMRVGFVHGVMNTDNMSVLGLTIDYGPYGWLENYDPSWTPNTTDAGTRRYCFGNQPAIAQWNLAKFANAVYPLIGRPEPFQETIANFGDLYKERWLLMMFKKLGLTKSASYEKEQLVARLLKLLEMVETDMTLFFRRMALLDVSENGNLDDMDRLTAPLSDSYYRPDQLSADYKAQLAVWLKDYAYLVAKENMNPKERRRSMDRINPKYVLRNYLAQQAIEKAEKKDYSMVHELMALLEHPYDEQPDMEEYAAKRPDWARNKPGCSMLSCSS